MALLKIIIVVIIITLLSGVVRSFLAKRHGRKLPKNSKNAFIAEELYKLNELKNRGIITEEEFQRQKSKLI